MYVPKMDAAKNYRFTAVIVNSARYGTVLAELKERDGHVSEETCFALAKEVFQRTAHYDAKISEFLSPKK